MEQRPPQFDEDTWAQLPSFFENLPEQVRLHVWGDGQASPTEAEAIRLAQLLDRRFETIDHRILPRRINYAYYPVIGVFRLEDGVAVDHGVRLIGLPAGFQLTSLIAAIQCVSFRGMTSEARTRIQLSRLTEDVDIELLTSAEDEYGAVMAQAAFNMAVFAPSVRAFLIMSDTFPDALVRYSVNRLPHLVINGRVHIEGLVDEQMLLEHIAVAIDSDESVDQ
ncbi:MAG TPA: thioredoxin family protein [Anaerolineae bacterium]|jgi:alkyl hydroperoxide reductase subunit AhpF|nr:thioredoxin family protein [Anaerolineae bacterium]